MQGVLPLVAEVEVSFQYLVWVSHGLNSQRLGAGKFSSAQDCHLLKVRISTQTSPPESVETITQAPLQVPLLELELFKLRSCLPETWPSAWFMSMEPRTHPQHYRHWMWWHPLACLTLRVWGRRIRSSRSLLAIYWVQCQSRIHETLSPPTKKKKVVSSRPA